MPQMNYRTDNCGKAKQGPSMVICLKRVIMLSQHILQKAILINITLAHPN